jgi:hypothetical protein
VKSDGVMADSVNDGKRLVILSTAENGSLIDVDDGVELQGTLPVQVRDGR